MSQESTRHPQQDARSGEKGHLGVVGNLCDAMPVQFKARDAFLAILLDDGIVGREFHQSRYTLYGRFSQFPYNQSVTEIPCAI